MASRDRMTRIDIAIVTKRKPKSNALHNAINRVYARNCDAYVHMNANAMLTRTHFRARFARLQIAQRATRFRDVQSAVRERERTRSA